MIYTAFNGRLTRNPEQGQTQRGTQYVTVNVATDSSRRDQNGEYLTTFVRVTVWGQRGDFVLQHFVKGDPIFVAGELVLTTYQTREGEQRSSLELTADNVGFVPQAPKNRAPQAPQQTPQMINRQAQRPQQNAPQAPQGQNINYPQAPQQNNQPQGQPNNAGTQYDQQSLDNLEQNLPF